MEKRKSFSYGRLLDKIRKFFRQKRGLDIYEERSKLSASG
jgi:GTP cyclohydrolase II